MYNLLDNSLERNHIDNEIYYDLTQDEYKYVEDNIIKNDYGFLDVLINSEVIKTLQNLPFSDSIENHENKQLLKIMILREYLAYKILDSSNIDSNIIKELSHNAIDILKYREIFSGNNLDDFGNSPFISFRIDAILSKYAEKYTNKKYARVHFMLDSVSDKNLQSQINNYIGYRDRTSYMCYTTKSDLISYTTENGVFIESLHDYRAFYNTDNKSKVYKK